MEKRTAITYKAIIFDLDGTLLDTLEDLSDSVNRVMTRRGFPTHTLDEYRYFIGDGTAMLIARALPKEERNDKTIRACLKAFSEDYGRNWNVKTRPYKGITEMLDALTERGLKIAVLSNKQHEFTKRCVADLLPKWTFDIVLGQRDAVKRKPDPAGALEVAQRLRVSPAEILYLGDSAVDMRTAAAAGMFPVGVLWGFRPAEELQESGAKALIERPLEILNLL
jgi:phosphoglycolate phosphatase